jgi:hypothetical protein
MSKQDRWEPMRLVRVGHVGEVVRQDVISPPTDLGTDEIGFVSTVIDNVA